MRAADTSVCVPAVLSWHPDHEACRRAAAGAAVPAHALLETYAVLTRLPAPHRVAADVAHQVLAAWFPPSRVLNGRRASGEVLSLLAGAGLGGGSTYDALIGLTAVDHGAVLVTKDARSVRTLAALDVPHRLLP